MKTRFAVKVAVLLLTFYLAFGFLQVPSYLKIDTTATIPDAMISVILFAALLFPAAYWGAKLSPENLPIISRLLGHEKTVIRELSRRILPVMGFAVLAFTLNVSLSVLFSWAWIPPTTQDYVLQFSIYDKVVSSVSAGIWEETIFRLFLISAALMIMRRKVPAVLLANLFFTLMHAVFQQPPYNAPALTVVFVIGLIYTKCFLDKGLGSAIACHAAMNLLSMTLGMFF